MLTKITDGDAVFDELAGEWDALAGRGMTDTPFQSLAYQRAWWRHLQPPGSSLHTITVRDEAGTLLAIASLYLFNGILYFNCGVEETDYLDLIAPAEQAEVAWTAVLDCLCSSQFPGWTAIDLCNVPAASPTRALLPRLAQERGLPFSEVVHEVCPVIQLPATFDEYLNGLDKKQRHEIRRKRRRANGAAATVTTIGPDDDLAQAVDDFLVLLQKSTPEKRDWLNDGRRALFHDTAKATLAAGALQLIFIEVNGQKAAALFNFDYKDHIWVYNSGLDMAVSGRLSLGVVLTANAIETAIENGRAAFDFLRGDEPYKYRFGAQDTVIYRLNIARNT